MLKRKVLYWKLLPYLPKIIISVLIIYIFDIFDRSFHSSFFHAFSFASIIMMLSIHIYSFFEPKIEKDQKQLEMERWRGLLLLFVPVLMVIGCSILNTAFYGETRLNKQILGFFLCSYPLMLLFLFGGYIEGKMNKSDNIHNNLKEQHDEHGKQLNNLSDTANEIKKITLDIKVEITETDQKLMKSIQEVFDGIKMYYELSIDHNGKVDKSRNYIELMLNRLEHVHGYAYTAEQVFALDDAKLKINNNIWKANQVREYFKIMGIKKDPSRIKGIKNLSGYCPKLVEKYVMPDVTKAREVLFRKYKDLKA